MASSTPEISAENERNLILAKATKLASENYQKHIAEFDALIKACHDQYLKFQSSNKSEAEAWENLHKKVTYLKKNATLEDADLLEYPEHITPIVPGAQLTIGDTHGNALKLLFFLISKGVVELKPKTDYATLVKIYFAEPTTRDHIKDFYKIITRAKVNPGAEIRLIGDEVGDRGANDYFNLKIIEKLKRNNVPVESIYSDHGADFIDFYEKGCPPNYDPRILGKKLARSVANLSKMVEDGLITSEALSILIEEQYLPNLKLLSYTLDEKTKNISLYFHAPVGTKTIQALANKFKVPYDDSTLQSLAKTIDNINEKFAKALKDKQVTNMLKAEENIVKVDIWKASIKEYIENYIERTRTWSQHRSLLKDLAKKLDVEFTDFRDNDLEAMVVLISTIYNAYTAKKSKGSLPEITKDERAFWEIFKEILHQKSKEGGAHASYDAPLHRVTWTRYDQDPHKELISTQKYEQNGYSIRIIHGHDAAGHSRPECEEYVRNLDSQLGKPGETEGKLKIHCNFEMTARQYKLHLARDRKEHGEEDREVKEAKERSEEEAREKERATEVTEAKEAKEKRESDAARKDREAREARAREEERSTERKDAADNKEIKETKETKEREEHEESRGSEPPTPEPSPTPNPKSHANKDLPHPETPGMLPAHAIDRDKMKEEGTVAVKAKITPEQVQRSFHRIRTSIKAANIDLNPENLYRYVTMVKEEPNNILCKIDNGTGKPDFISRTIKDDDMEAKLSRHSKDPSILLFFDMNLEFSPLMLTKPCNDSTLLLPLKVLEAARMKGVEVELAETDRNLFAALHPNDPKRQHYELLINKPEEFLNKVKGMKDRKLGDPIPEISAQPFIKP